jgi:uncharacterized protein
MGMFPGLYCYATIWVSKIIMSKKDIIKILSDYKKEFAEQYGILDIGVFGSVARDEVGVESDVDVVVRISKPDLFMLVGIKHELEKRLHRPVDIVTYRESMNQFLKKRIDGEAVYA